MAALKELQTGKKISTNPQSDKKFKGLFTPTEQAVRTCLLHSTKVKRIPLADWTLLLLYARRAGFVVKNENGDKDNLTSGQCLIYPPSGVFSAVDPNEVFFD